MSLKLKLATVASALVAGLVLNLAPASAEIMRSEGCVEWSAEDGCTVYQVCTLNTETRVWSCYTVPQNGDQPTMEGGRY